MGKRCFIFAAGTCYALEEKPAGDDLVIAADAGYRTCRALGLVPDLLVGDFDSMDQPADFARIVRLPVEKDDTDTTAAARRGLAAGCTEFHIYGGTGGARLDHTLANLQLLLLLRRSGSRGYLHDDGFVFTAIENETMTVPKRRDRALLSVFCADGTARGVKERGVQYPLTDATLRSDLPLGVSNHILDEAAEVSVTAGALFVGWELA